MHLSVITDEITQDFERALDIALEYGVHVAELRGLWNTNIADLDGDQVKRARQALRDRGMKVSCLSTPVFKCDLWSDEGSVRGRMHLAKARGLGEQHELFRRCCGFAHQFGTKLIRVFTFWRQGELTPAVEEQIVASFGELIKIADAEDVTAVLENEHACFIGTGAEASRVLSELDSPRVRSCWDPGNAYLAGEKPYPSGFESIRPFLAHVHVKDAKVAPDGKDYAWTVMGEGDIDYDGQFQALREERYEGAISLETHFIPQGGTPEDGSRSCLAALRRMLC